jgi:AcrR family transcriptional regulator
MVHVEACESLDPRIRRTRQLLQQALEKLLETKEFDKISVQDIADSATVNRATFYDHYADKFALLESLVGSRFQELLVERGVQFDGTCTSALTAIVLAVCDYLIQVQGPHSERQLEPHMESAIITVVRRMLLEGLKRHQSENGPIAPEMIAAAASWAIYGASKEWCQTPDRRASEEIANTVTRLVSPIVALHKELAQG